MKTRFHCFHLLYLNCFSLNHLIELNGRNIEYFCQVIFDIYIFQVFVSQLEMELFSIIQTVS